MVRNSITRLSFSKPLLQHADVVDLERTIAVQAPGRVVVLDLRQTRETTTAALAGLILLRRRQIQAGGDLLLLGLTGKANYLYEILRLANILPRRPCIHPRRAEQIRFGRSGDISRAEGWEARRASSQLGLSSRRRNTSDAAARAAMPSTRT
jgi:hypothetical protein